MPPHGYFERTKINFHKVIDYFGGFVNYDKEHLCKFMLIYFKNISRDEKVRISFNYLNPKSLNYYYYYYYYYYHFYYYYYFYSYHESGFLS